MMLTTSEDNMVKEIVDSIRHSLLYPPQESRRILVVVNPDTPIDLLSQVIYRELFVGEPVPALDTAYNELLDRIRLEFEVIRLDIIFRVVYSEEYQYQRHDIDQPTLLFIKQHQGK